MLPTSAAVESVTTHTYPHAFKILSIQHIFSVYYFLSHLVKTILGEGLLYYINRKIRHPVIWRRADCKLVKYVGLQDTQIQTHNWCSHPLGFLDKCLSSQSLFEPVLLLLFVTHLNSLTHHFNIHHFPLCC